MDNTGTRSGRRTFLRQVGAGATTVGLALAGCTPVPGASASSSPSAPTSARRSTAVADPADPKAIRLSSVVILQESGLYASILPEFEARTGYRVEVATAQDVYGPARDGRADIVLSHYQHAGVAAFVQEGFGEWPRLVFSSPGAIIGPPSDPAGVRGAASIEDALRAIARSGATFTVNDIDGLRYVATVARGAAGLAADSAFFVDKGTRGADAMRAAAQSAGYTLWGVVPFLRQQQQAKLPLEILFTRDQLLKSVMATIVVNAQKVDRLNTVGARSLQSYLLEAATQAKIRAFRMASSNEQLWWTAAQDNEQAAMPRP